MILGFCFIFVCVLGVIAVIPSVFFWFGFFSLFDNEEEVGAVLMAMLVMLVVELGCSLIIAALMNDSFLAVFMGEMVIGLPMSLFCHSKN